MTLSISPILPTTTQAATLGVALQPGTIVSAQVLQSLDANLVRIAIASLTLDVATTMPLQAGQTLQLAVTQTKDGISLSPVSPQTTSNPRGDAVIVDDIPLAPKLAGQGDPVRLALSPAETKAVAGAAQAAVAKQTSLSPLFANLTSAVTSDRLPQPVMVAATQVLGLRMPTDRALTGADIKTAMQTSGLMREASLAIAVPSQAAPMPDMKAALGVLRQALATWINEPATQGSSKQVTTPTPQSLVGDKTNPAIAARANALALSIMPDVDPNDAPARQPTTTNALRSPASDNSTTSARTTSTPPPFRDALPSAQAVAASTLAADAKPLTIAQHLIADTDGAIARQILLQIASLPEQVAGPRNEALQLRWNFEIPFVTPQGTAMAQFAIARDGAANDVDPAQRVWRARFSLDIEPAGPVHALISFSNQTTSVKMWAERPATAAQLRVNATQLSASLDRADLKSGDIVVADGAPARMKAPSAGHFLNRAS